MSDWELCEPGGAGIVLPLFGDAEQEWPRALRIVLYLLGLAWLFQGVGVVCDSFMDSIEQITSKKERRFDRQRDRYVTVVVWNATMANLTLMALGSSAPEILLSVIEAFSLEFFSGRLGPSTIVGSAAFNLLVITAICIVAIPDSEIRKINDTSVYAVTATFSILAYAWTVFVLKVTSPNVIEPWEGLVTFLMLPLLLVLAYLADKGHLDYFFSKTTVQQSTEPKAVLDPGISKEYLAELEAKVRQTHSAENLSSRQVAKLLQFYYAQPTTRAAYRRLSRVRTKERLSGGRSSDHRNSVKKNRVVPVMEGIKEEMVAGTGETEDAAAASRRAASTPGSSKETTQTVLDVKEQDGANQRPVPGASSATWPQQAGTGEAGEAICPPAPLPPQPPLPGHATPALPEDMEPPQMPRRPSVSSTADKVASPVSFELQRVAVIWGTRAVRLGVMRREHLGDPLVVAFRTREGTAKASNDFVPKEGRLEFAPSQSEGHILIELTPTRPSVENQEFHVDLLNPETDQLLSTVSVVSLIDDDPGVLQFQNTAITVVEGRGDSDVYIVVERSDGCGGKVGCKYHTEDCSAVAGVDYEAAEGVVELETHQTSATVTLKIKGRGRCERTDMLRLVLTDPFGGARFDPRGDGGAESCIAYVIIEPSKEQSARINGIFEVISRNWQKAHPNHDSWRAKFVEALQVDPSDESDGEEDREQEDSPSPGALFLMWFDHILTLPWKLLFALVPPPGYCGGWACFFCSLFGIGCVTAVVKDMAGLLGCVMRIPDEVTAITLVALGTSLPDTFASKTAAMQDPFADASIGNVTGSNSVNVFLGLGLPWMIGSMYWVIGGTNAEWRRRYGGSSPPGWAADFQDGALIVEADSLSFCVMVFTCCAFSCILMLWARRSTIGGELGGPVRLKYSCAAFLLLLWVLFVGLSSFEMLRAK